jgi:hypothetical protein
VADAVVRRVGHRQVGVPIRLGGRIIAIQIGAPHSPLHHDGIDPDVGCPVKGVTVEVADNDGLWAAGVRPIGQISAFELELCPGLARSLEIGTRLARVAGTLEKLRLYGACLCATASDGQQRSGGDQKSTCRKEHDLTESWASPHMCFSLYCPLTKTECRGRAVLFIPVITVFITILCQPARCCQPPSDRSGCISSRRRPFLTIV